MATPRINKTDSFEASLKCPICLDVLVNPKSLPCRHSYCFECLQKQEQANYTGFITKCPLCQSQLTPVKAIDLPPDFIAQQMIDKLPSIRTFVKGNKEKMLETIMSLIAKRKTLLDTEKRAAKEMLQVNKEEVETKIEQTARDLIGQVKDAIEMRTRKLLRDVKDKHEANLREFESHVQRLDNLEEIISWLSSSTDDGLAMSYPPKEVIPSSIPAEMNFQFASEFSSEVICRSLDPGNVISNVNNDSKTLQAAAYTSEEFTSIENYPRSLTSNVSHTTLVHNPISGQIIDLANAPPEPSTLPLVEKVLSKQTDHVEKERSPQIRENMEMDDQRLVWIQQWVKGAPGEKKSRGSRPTSDPSALSKNVKTNICRSASNDTIWQLRQSKIQLQIKGMSKLMLLNVVRDFTTVAVETEHGGTKMWVFPNGTGKRRHPLKSTKGKSSLTGIATLTDNEGWCMLLKDVLLTFDFHGILTVEHSFYGQTFLGAVSYKTDSLVYVDDHFDVGIMSLSKHDPQLQTLKLDFKLSGTIFSLATANDTLFIAHKENESCDGNIICLSGLQSGSIKQTRTICPPSGFADACCPMSMCCDKHGNLFALWRDGSNCKGIIMEYCVEEKDINSIVLEEADDIFAISFAPEGALVTCSIKQ